MKLEKNILLIRKTIGIHARLKNKINNKNISLMRYFEKYENYHQSLITS